MNWLPQTKRVIGEMNELGFTYRKDFTTKTPCDHRGSYQNTVVYFKKSAYQKAYDLRETIKEGGYRVHVLIYKGELEHVTAEETYKPYIFVKEM